MKDFSPRNILVIHFGQMGDVILALPAFQALRSRFPDARLTAMAGKSAALIPKLAGVFDETIVVDRVALRDGNKIASVKQIIGLARDIRRRKFDFVVDLHSLAETNLLGFLSGAGARLYANRENRSLDFLSRFPVRPAREDKTAHVTDRYLAVLAPLGIASAPRFVSVSPSSAEIEFVREKLAHEGAANSFLFGVFPGAGHPSRRWPLDNFAELARRANQFRSDLRTVVFLGPEEAELAAEVREKFGPDTIIFDKLSIPQLLAATSLLGVLVSNDTGVLHIGAISGVNLVLVIDERAPSTYLPLAENLAVVRNGKIDEITVDSVFEAATVFLGNSV